MGSRLEWMRNSEQMLKNLEKEGYNTGTNPVVMPPSAATGDVAPIAPVVPPTDPSMIQQQQKRKQLKGSQVLPPQYLPPNYSMADKKWIKSFLED